MVTYLYHSRKGVVPRDAASFCTVGDYLGIEVMGSLMLAAHELGLGSCWINRAKEEFDTQWGKDLLKSLGVEGEYEGIGHCALGYIDGDVPQAAPRKGNRVFYIK